MSFKPRLLGSISPTRVEILCMAVGQWEKTGPHGIPIYSTEESLRASVELFRDLPVAAYELKPGFADHIPQMLKDIANSKGISFFKNVVGWLRNPRFGDTKDGERGIIAEFEITDSDVAAVVRSALDSGQVDLPGFSVDGNVSEWEIKSIDNVPYDTFTLEKLDTLDIVNYPAAGGRVLRLAASKTIIEKEKRTMPEKVKNLLISLLSAVGVTQEKLISLFAEGADFGKGAVDEIKNLLKDKPDMLKRFDGLVPKIEANEDVSKELAELNTDYSKFVQSELDKKITEAKKSVKPEPVVNDKEADDVLAEARKIAEEAKAQNEELKVELGTAKIETEIKASALPPQAKAKLQERLVASKTFKVEEIKKAIDDEVKYLNEIGVKVDNPIGARITASGDSEFDVTMLAVQGMFSREPLKDSKGNIVKPFRSLREMSHRITGSKLDCNMSEIWKRLDGFNRGFSASNYVDLDTGRITGAMVSTDLSEILGVSMHRQMMKEYTASDFNFWRPLVEVMSLEDLKAHTYQRLGVYPTFATVTETGTYQDVTSSPTDEEVTMTLAKYGAIESINEKMILNDDLRSLTAIPRKLAEAMAEDVMRMCFDPMYNNDAVAYGSDTATLVHASSHSNGAASGGSTLTDISLNAAMVAMMGQIAYGASGTRNKLGAKNLPKYLLTGPSLFPLAQRLTLSDRLAQVGGTSGSLTAPQLQPDSGAINVFKGITPMCVPYWTSTTNWWTLADPLKAGAFLYVGFLNGKDTPELVTEAVNTGSDFTADKKRMKIKMYRTAVIADHRPIYGQLA